MRMRICVKLGLALGLVLLAACQPMPPRDGFYSSPVGPGDEIEVLRELVIPAGLARVYLQHGKTSGYAATDQYAPFCYVLLRDPLPVAQTLGPGRWAVERVWLNQTDVSLGLPRRVAARMALGGGDASMMAWQFHITLASQHHRRVTLVCSGAFDVPSLATPIRLPEMREAFGDYATVRVGERPETR